MLRGMATIHDCCLCSQISGQPDNDLIARMLPGEPYVRRIMLESSAFAVLPDLGPLVPGHSLLCTKTHTRSFAHLDDALHDEFASMKRTLRASLQELYGGEVHVFEHGMAGEGNRVLCTVDHAHMHFLPMRAMDLDVEGVVFDGSLAELRRISGGNEYVLYESPGGEARVRVENGIESQYMRRIVANAIGREEWNWRELANARAADAAWRRFTASA